MNNRTEIKDNCVIKQYRDRISFENERMIYRNLPADGLVPVLREEGERTLVLERLPGQTFSAWLDTGPSPSEAAKLIAEWICRFEDAAFTVFGQYPVLEDLNPRNLIVTPDGICGIDFEYWHSGTREEALAVMCSMARTLYGGADIAACLEQRLSGAAVPEGRIKAEAERIRQRRAAMENIRRSACIILAGGKASRMNGAAKGLLALGEYTFIERILHTVQLFDRIRISANTHDYDALGYPVIPDAVQDCGPMGALYTALMDADTEHVFTVPCDTPLLKRDTIVRMYRMLDDQDAVILRTAGRIHPTIGIYRKRILPVVEKQVREKDYRMRSLLEKIRTAYCDTDNPWETMNINTPDDLKQIIKKHSV
ncbi:MAG: NTP transferase domain-containing protein [Solobacterium sp.]|nr:NTP transferase domain-containing protein [Solobacterium sp.]